MTRDMTREQLEEYLMRGDCSTSSRWMRAEDGMVFGAPGFPGARANDRPEDRLSLCDVPATWPEEQAALIQERIAAALSVSAGIPTEVLQKMATALQEADPLRQVERYGELLDAVGASHRKHSDQAKEAR